MRPPATALATQDLAPIRGPAFGSMVSDQGYYVGQVEGNLYWVTDGTYQAAFLTTCDGVVLFDAPPTIGHNLQRAVDEIAAANGVSNKVTYLIYSHHHADHAGASSLFDRNIIRIGHEETRKLLLRDDDPARPAPRKPFRTAALSRSAATESNWSGTAPITRPTTSSSICPTMPHSCSSTSSTRDGRRSARTTSPMTYPATSRPRSIAHLPVEALHRWSLGPARDPRRHRHAPPIHGGHRGQLTEGAGHHRSDSYFVRHGESTWVAMRDYLDATTAAAATPIIEKYAGVLAAADVFTAGTTFHIIQSIRLDLGYGSQVHP